MNNPRLSASASQSLIVQELPLGMRDTEHEMVSLLRYILNTHDTHPTSQRLSLAMQMPSDMTGWVGGKHSLAAAEATWTCILEKFSESFNPYWETRTKSSQQYVSVSGPRFSKKNLQVPNVIVWT